MLGLFVLALIFGYITLISKLFKRFRPWWAKAMVVAAAICIPTADAVYGRMKLKRLCEVEGGVHLYRDVGLVDGFETAASSVHKDWLGYGYQFVEGKTIDGKPARLSRNPDGTIRQEMNVMLKSEYSFGTTIGNVKDTYFRIEYVVRNRNSSEVIGRFTNIGFNGGWFERYINRIGAGSPVAVCGKNISIIEFVTKILKPINREAMK
ncbi:MAG: hypothetical protein LBL72_03435 [Candidatus Accumulibacter sp.]|jgi:hypothetical protein|nr:hypothetical protein [Accumulibacter sp.]